MSTDVFSFKTLPELRAFECGVHFSEAPVATEHAGLLLSVRSAFDDEIREHHYSPIIFAPTCDLGDRILTSRIAFATATEAVAFTTAIAWYGGCANVALRGKRVIVEQDRPDNEQSDLIEYEFETLRALIADFRANIQSPSASA